jgi:hypothetical protein
VSQRLIATAVFTACFGWFAATAAHGQYARRAPISRPSYGPSSRLGIVGGVYTRQYDVSALDRGAGPPAGPRGLPLPSFFGAAGGLGRLPPSPMPQALTFAPVGYDASGGLSPVFGSLSGASNMVLARVSGLQASQSLTVPLTGLGPYQLAFPDRPYYLPEPQGSALHEFFGLKPTEAEGAPAVPVPVDGLVGLLEQENGRFLYEVRSQALRTFKRAMTEGVAERGELLSTAQQQLSTLRDLDRQAYLPCLLLTHVALENDQLLQAMGYLAEAVRRHPSVFVEGLDIASYYGDAKLREDKQHWRSELLERQMRKHLRIGDENPGTPSTYVLQAYCAWVLNDQIRVKHALERLAAAEQEAQVSARIIPVRYALAAAMN